MLLLGGNRISIHSLYPFHLHRGLDRGAFWIQSHSHTNDLLWAGRPVAEGAGHKAACSWLCGYNEFKKVRKQSRTTLPSPPKNCRLPNFPQAPLWRSAKQKFTKGSFELNWVVRYENWHSLSMIKKYKFFCVRFNKSSCLTAKADNAALYLRGDKNTNWFTWYGDN